jgi:hypothetical protein
MKNSVFFIAGLMLLCTVLVFACRKKDFTSSQTLSSKQSTAKGFSELMASGTCISDYNAGNGYDSILKPTILGYHLQNHPYSLTNMQQAYYNLYGSTSGVTLTHKYVRFKPSTPAQLSALVDLDNDLFDHPLDYEVVQEGDYYDDGVTPAEEIPWLYAVVDIGFTAPAGISYEVLEQVHIPVLAAVENEAFRITSNPFDNSSCIEETLAESEASKIQPRYPSCVEGYHWDMILQRCVPDNCPPGYHWNMSVNDCVPDGPPPPTFTRQPSGTLRVRDNNNGTSTLRGIRNARVIAKNFLKVERTFTNTNGDFFLNKEFNKVRLFAEFENEQAIIRTLRKARIWQMLTPVKRDFGGLKGDLNNQNLVIEYNGNAKSKLARYWAAATAHNTVQEYRDFTSLQQTGNPPNHLKVLLTNWTLQGTSGAAPMFAKRGLGAPSDFITTFLISNLGGVAGGMQALVLYLESEVDVTAGYNRGGTTTTSDQLSETLFHEQTHAAHYNKVGNAWWTSFVNAELHEMIIGPLPYGDGNNSFSPIIALGESWAYHMGHFATDWKYGGTTGPFREQGIWYFNNNPIGGLSSNINLLEDFSPYRTNDPFYWIPQGLYYDLIDAHNEQRISGGPVDDNVSNYTNHEMFNALQTDILNLQDYRARLLQQTSNSTSPFVPNLFVQYGY